jgi:hypothetical protein
VLPANLASRPGLRLEHLPPAAALPARIAAAPASGRRPLDLQSETTPVARQRGLSAGNVSFLAAPAAVALLPAVPADGSPYAVGSPQMPDSAIASAPPRRATPAAGLSPADVIGELARALAAECDLRGLDA